ncbi:hypothetical protein EDD18DRAFT_1311005 [Armillaria luteobubalina]|uniref:Uncharacterized protein n=1 Tax=Armillaria luteobubalina TaxID=153913 RepID=A0AA39PXC7_9AGAR|nr:hypothetical protein EDD18DRAFT_1311005 [Armillaria luteobubalina]
MELNGVYTPDFSHTWQITQRRNDFNPFWMLVVDQLHEFELGVWKALFTHLIQLLYAEDPSGELVSRLNLWYHQVTAFSWGTIHKFAMNSAEMKKLAACDFEDLLQIIEGEAFIHYQCTIPVFEGLLPEPLNTSLMTLLYQVAEWHVLAKLHMHTEQSLACRPQKLNLSTFKFHSLGDYITSIQLFGTTDSYSSQMGELAHCLIKNLYGLTNKKNVMAQVAKNRNEYFDMYQFVLGISSPASSSSSHVDPAKKSFTNEQRNLIYCHHIMHVNYTTYNVHRDYDTINPSRYVFITVKSPEMDGDAHPYWYAQVLGIYHTNVQHFGMELTDMHPHHMYFLWVRWLSDEPGWKSSCKFACLPKIGFVPDSDDYAFGFLDPSVVIWGVHLLPDFSGSQTTDLLQTNYTTIAWKIGEEEDWVNYYVNM